MEITFRISDEKVQRVVDAMKGLYPIPIDFETMEPLFTDNQWAREKIRRWIRDQVARYEQMAAQDKIEYSPEDEIISEVR